MGFPDLSSLDFCGIVIKRNCPQFSSLGNLSLIIYGLDYAMKTNFVCMCVCVCVCVCVQEFNLETKTLENYFLIISAIEDNLVEFKKIQEQLTEVIY